MKRVPFTALLIFLFISAPVHAQRDSLRTLFLDAESWFLFEDYSEALPLYEALLDSDPGNDQLKYKIGVCLLNDPYQKDQAIQYLLDASKNIDPSYKENNYREQAAPPDVLYYLGSAYLVNELLDRAIDSYEEFLEIMDPGIYDPELVEAQIQACRNAKRMRTMPVDIDLFLLDSVINNAYPNIRPVVSGDGTKMAYVTELPFYDGAFYTEKTEEGWSYPQQITPMLGYDEDIYPVALSFDGTEMILYYDDNYIGNLYYSRRENGVWTPAVRMEEPISTKYWESDACFSRDGQSLYFTSNRKGTLGGLDIWVSHKDAGGNWGEPANLGPTINSRFNEESPSLSGDGGTLYFSSYGHYNMGGYDIFYSRKNKDGSWAEPVNIGYPINTTDHDLYFQPLLQGNAAYYALYSPRGMGRHDIYYMDIYSADHPRYYSVQGRIRTEEGSRDTTRMAVYVIDAEDGDTADFVQPAREGMFTLQLKQGTYELHFTGDGYREEIRPLQITPAANKQGMTLPDDIVLASLIPAEDDIEVYEGTESRIGLKEHRFEAEAGVLLTVPLTAPQGSTLVVRTYKDSSLIHTDTVVASGSRTELQIVPAAGLSRVVLEMTDSKGNIHRDRLEVSGILTEDQEAQEPAEQETEEDASVSAGPSPEAGAGQIRSEEPGEQVPTEGAGEQVLPEEPGDQIRTDEYREGVQADEQRNGAQVAESGKRARSWPLLLLIGIAGAGLLWLIIAWWRRREKSEEQED